MAHLFENASLAPCFKVVVHYLPVRKTTVKITPLSTCSGYPEDGIENFSQIIFARTLPVQKNFYTFPLVIGEPFKLRLHIVQVLSLTRYADGHFFTGLTF
jgi:hypothetical protein